MLSRLSLLIPIGPGDVAWQRRIAGVSKIQGPVLLAAIVGRVWPAIWGHGVNDGGWSHNDGVVSGTGTGVQRVAAGRPGDNLESGEEYFLCQPAN